MEILTAVGMNYFVFPHLFSIPFIQSALLCAVAVGVSPLVVTHHQHQGDKRELEGSWVGVGFWVLGVVCWVGVGCFCKHPYDKFTPT